MRGGAGWGRSKKCKPIPAPLRGVGLKSHPILAPPPLRGGENPYGAKRGGAGQAGRGKIAIPRSINSMPLLMLRDERGRERERACFHGGCDGSILMVREKHLF